MPSIRIGRPAGPLTVGTEVHGPGQPVPLGLVQSSNVSLFGLVWALVRRGLP